MIASDSQHKEPSSPCLQYPTEDVKLGTDQSTKYEQKTKNKNSLHLIHKPIKMYHGTKTNQSKCIMAHSFQPHPVTDTQYLKRV